MLTPTLRLVLAMALAVSAVTFLAITLNAVNARESAPAIVTPLKAKILRRQDKLKDKLSANEKAALRSQASTQDERKFEDEIPKHVPIKFKLRADKEKKFKDLNNPGWYRDFELEVTNSSNKPIYYLEFDLVYPEIDAAPGVPLAMTLRYGRADFIYHNTRPLPTDVPLQPGETYIFRVSDSERRGWEWHKKNEDTPDPKRAVLEFGGLSFGDGTGYDTLQAIPYPYRRNRSATSPCREGPAPVVAKVGEVNDRSNDFDASTRNQSLLRMTGKYFAGYFFATASKFSFLGEPAVLGAPSVPLDACCGSGCYYMKPEEDSCSCGIQSGNSYPACTDPDGTCGTPHSFGHWCEGLGVYCPGFRIDVCISDVPTPPPTPVPSPTLPPSPTPTPTETPTPEPVCDPATKPNNSNCSCVAPLIPGQSAQWSCFCWVTGQSGFPVAGVPANYPLHGQTQGGCPINMVNNGSNCCVCIVNTCPNGSRPNSQTCECPSPTPTPLYRGEYNYHAFNYGYDGYCTPYFWVWYVSYDGGATWQETGESEYAGCW